MLHFCHAQWITKDSERSADIIYYKKLCADQIWPQKPSTASNSARVQTIDADVPAATARIQTFGGEVQAGTDLWRWGTWRVQTFDDEKRVAYIPLAVRCVLRTYLWRWGACRRTVRSCRRSRRGWWRTSRRRPSGCRTLPSPRCAQTRAPSTADLATPQVRVHCHVIIRYNLRILATWQQRHLLIVLRQSVGTRWTNPHNTVVHSCAVTLRVHDCAYISAGNIM